MAHPNPPAEKVWDALSRSRRLPAFNPCIVVKPLAVNRKLFVHVRANGVSGFINLTSNAVAELHPPQVAAAELSPLVGNAADLRRRAAAAWQPSITRKS